jgi:type II secretory pathway predicted ATPase ExeA
VTHFGLSRTPFGKSIAAKDLYARQAHQEAVARINFCIGESALGVLTGDVGAGKTVAVRAAVAALDPTRHQLIYIANPGLWHPRPLRHHRARAGRRASLPQSRTDGPGQ